MVEVLVEQRTIVLLLLWLAYVTYQAAKVVKAIRGQPERDRLQEEHSRKVARLTRHRVGSEPPPSLYDPSTGLRLEAPSDGPSEGGRKAPKRPATTSKPGKGRPRRG